MGEKYVFIKEVGDWKIYFDADRNRFMAKDSEGNEKTSGDCEQLVKNLSKEKKKAFTPIPVFWDEGKKEGKITSFTDDGEAWTSGKSGREKHYKWMVGNGGLKLDTPANKELLEKYKSLKASANRIADEAEMIWNSMKSAKPPEE